jgi:heat shock protein HslJ
MNRIAARTLLPFLLLTTLAAACAAVAAPADLKGRTFLSTAVRDGDADRPLVPGTRISLTFAADGNLGVAAGCNHIGGTYRIADGALLFEGGGMTERGCDQARHEQDDWLVKVLGASPRVALAGNELVLTSGSVTVRLLDEEVAAPDVPLVGTLWTVDTIIDGDAASGFAGPVAATIQFGDDGSVVISTGCNQGGGTVVTDGATLRFSGILLTKRACLDGPGAFIESAILEVLGGGAVGYEIDGSRLTLMREASGLALHGG